MEKYFKTFFLTFVIALFFVSCKTTQISSKIVFSNNDTVSLTRFDKSGNIISKIDFIQELSNKLETKNLFENDKLIETQMFFDNLEISKVIYEYDSKQIKSVSFYEYGELILEEFYSYIEKANTATIEVLRKDKDNNTIKFISHYIDSLLVRQLEIVDENIKVEKIYIYDTYKNLIEINVFHGSKIQLIDKFEYDKLSRLITEKRYQSDEMVLHIENKFKHSRLKEKLYLNEDSYIVRQEKYKYYTFKDLLRRKLIVDYRVYSEEDSENMRPSKTEYKFEYKFFKNNVSK